MGDILSYPLNVRKLKGLCFGYILLVVVILGEGVVLVPTITVKTV